MESKKVLLEYVWLDGYQPEPTLRSKIKIIDRYCTNLNEVPEWGFDGSSTQQAEGSSSDCILKPIRLYDSPFESDQLVLCEVYNADGTPHSTNTRSNIASAKQKEYWFGFEQEYTLMKNGRPLEWPEDTTKYPKEQGDYYCGVGGSNIGSLGRRIMHEHTENCLRAGVSIHGTNAEVMLGQWEYQVFGRGAKKAADNAWIARYILYRTAEKHNVDVNIEPKPIKGDWNGNGMHTNFSTSAMRDSYDAISAACEAMGAPGKPEEHLAGYGIGIEDRLTGEHETQRFDQFSYGVSDRGASIRIPWQVAKDGKGYIEDRRPNANADPYVVATLLTNTICSALA